MKGILTTVIGPFYRYIRSIITTMQVEANPFSKRRKRPVFSKYAVYTRDVLKGKNFEIGEYTYGTPTVFTYFSDRKLRIGKFCAIGGKVTIHLAKTRRTDLVATYPFDSFPDDWQQAGYLKTVDLLPTSEENVVIGNDVWIGYGATIMPGVKIGHGAIIGAKAVVTNDVEPYSIVAGNPARLIKKRLDEETINRLLQIRWWDWPIEKINDNLRFLCSNNYKELFELD